MFHWRQQLVATIIITAVASRRLICIKLLHLQRECLVPLSNSNV
jgi:hypothetical protein